MQNEKRVQASKITKASESGKRLGGKRNKNWLRKGNLPPVEYFVSDVLGTKVLGIN